MGASPYLWQYTIPLLGGRIFSFQSRAVVEKTGPPGPYFNLAMTMNRRAKKDNNHNNATRPLEQIGLLHIVDTHHVGQLIPGFPDALGTTFNGLTILGNFDPREVQTAIAGIAGVKIILDGATVQIEVKNPDTDHTLTNDQVIYHQFNPVVIIENAEDIHDQERLRSKYVP